MSDVTRILSQIDSGDPSAAERLLPLVYEELRNLAANRLTGENPGHSLNATALVHEALPPNAKSIEFLRSFPKLTDIGFKDDPKNGYRAEKIAAEFWRDYDEQKQ
jgi:hypothetical protein